MLDEHKHNFDIHINHIEHEAVCGDSLRIQQVFVNLMSKMCIRDRALENKNYEDAFRSAHTLKVGVSEAFL